MLPVNSNYHDHFLGNTLYLGLILHSVIIAKLSKTLPLPFTAEVVNSLNTVGSNKSDLYENLPVYPPGQFQGHLLIN